MGSTCDRALILDVDDIGERDDRRTTLERYSRDGWLLFAHAWRPDVGAGGMTVESVRDDLARLRDRLTALCSAAREEHPQPLLRCVHAARVVATEWHHCDRVPSAERFVDVLRVRLTPGEPGWPLRHRRTRAVKAAER